MSNLVIVAIPEEDDRIWKLSSEKVPHLTLLFLGEVPEEVAPVVQFVEHAIEVCEHGPFMMEIDHRDKLGDDEADVYFFKKDWSYKWINQFRTQLLQEPHIRAAYESVEQYDEWRPHLTLGYPETPAKEDDSEYKTHWVNFDRIAVWTDDYDGPEFRLEWPERMEDIGLRYSAVGEAAVADILGAEHSGVKGMRWGHRKEKIKSVAKATSKFVQDVHFESRTEDNHANTLVASAAHKPFKKDMEKINAKPEYQKAKSLKNRLRNPRDPLTKQYRKEARETYIKRLEESANAMKNASGTREYTIRERGIDLPAKGGALPTSKYFWDVSARNVTHAADVPNDVIQFEVIMDEDGFITELKPIAAEDAMEQAADLGKEFLAHYGVKGQKWGQRRAEMVTRQHQSALAAETQRRDKRPSQDVRTVATIGTSKRKKSTIEAKGGEDHPPTEDAINVAVAKQKLKKSGPAALTNVELAEVQRRLNLENDVVRLTSAQRTSGQRFVDGLLGRGSKDDRRGAENQAGQAAQDILKKQALKKFATGAAVVAL